MPPGSIALVVALSLLSPGRLPAQSAELRKAKELVVAGKPQEAIPIYDALVKAAPDNPTLLVNLAVAHFQAKNYSEAIRVSEAALGVRPGLVAALLFLGASHFQLGRHAEAIGPLSQVLEAKPAERNARLMLAESLLQLA
ncbi:MAG: tetratricopeptide repeat protein, partial [bacterium]|nr:tetratricopeptide repeat protein [bacterium]